MLSTMIDRMSLQLPRAVWLVSIAFLSIGQSDTVLGTYCGKRVCLIPEITVLVTQPWWWL